MTREEAAGLLSDWGQCLSFFCRVLHLFLSAPFCYLFETSKKVEYVFTLMKEARKFPDKSVNIL